LRLGEGVVRRSLGEVRQKKRVSDGGKGPLLRWKKWPQGHRVISGPETPDC